MWKLLEAHCDPSLAGHTSPVFVNVAAFFLNKEAGEEAAEEDKHSMGPRAVVFCLLIMKSRALSPSWGWLCCALRCRREAEDRLLWKPERNRCRSVAAQPRLFSLVLSERFLLFLSSRPLVDGEDPEKLNPPALKNGHTVPIGGPGAGNPDSQEEEPPKSSSLRKPVPAEEPKKRQGKKAERAGLFASGSYGASFEFSPDFSSLLWAVQPL